MKEYVLDTHTFVWWTARPKHLGPAAARVLRQVDTGRAQAWIPSIIGIEISLLGEAGRIRLGVADLEAAIRRNSMIRILPHDLEQALEFDLLGSLRDPFDRMIVGAARATKRPLITADERIQASGLVEVIWD
ncbi:MAG: PilT protein domain protein [Myxococcales bacterium]|nr:PilT protein domain protein [Myxococcales bacterium]